MAADLEVLVPEFRDKVKQLIQRCEGRGVIMRPTMSRRTPQEQGKLWRQSRSIEQINAKVAFLRGAGADFLADCIEKAGPQHGSPVTNAIPGYSWHQWDEALDCFWLVNKEAEWSTSRLVNGVNGYHVYVDEAEKLDLNAGGNWHSLKDWPHVQLRSAASPEAVMSIKQINEAMAQRFKK
jgi:peptidoglycan L-alanyl-D-glutamate endopeptidase CwlK